MNYKSTLLLFAVACGDGGTAETDETLTWFAHPCGNGDPVTFECPTAEVEIPLDDDDWPLCSTDDLAAGDTCDRTGDRCVLEPAVACDSDPTNQIRSANYLHCQAEDFESGECPQSSRDVKLGIHHLADHERRKVSEQVLAIDLATYRYRDNEGPEGQQLGFIIQETDGPFLQQGGERVNLYAYISAVVATVQQQQEEIEALKAELHQLQRSQADPPAR
mgnify:CR=1 FL=1